MVAAAGLPVEFAHIVLAHTHRTKIDPATLEAAIISPADSVAADAIRARAVITLREA